ncbi:hypothetical protein [Streptomyces sp. MUSC 14]|uniref:hypothetical protein n=1 Tax=Streptomyces sp. MUSC 14 TaxID=1354889 RepID=UPI00210ED079|nr:hypothetical protein [Streptomyces sp. MUSC 14]
MAEVPDELIKLERCAEEERAKLAGLRGEEYEARLRRWCKAAEAVQAAITAFATANGTSRFEVEKSVKEALRHAHEDPAVE